MQAGVPQAGHAVPDAGGPPGNQTTRQAEVLQRAAVARHHQQFAVFQFESIPEYQVTQDAN